LNSIDNLPRSLSIIAPVRNHAASLASRVEQLLDWVSDLCHDVQLLLVNDGSVDGTEEVLEELKREYPQVEVLHNDCRQGPSKATEHAIRRARGELIFVHSSYEPVDLEELQQLWRLRQDRHLVFARVSTRIHRVHSPNIETAEEGIGRNHDSSASKNRESVPSMGEMASQAGLQMLRRESLASLSVGMGAYEELEVEHFRQQTVTPVMAP
jgi:hypothetical protein